MLCIRYDRGGVCDTFIHLADIEDDDGYHVRDEAGLNGGRRCDAEVVGSPETYYQRR